MSNQIQTIPTFEYPNVEASIDDRFSALGSVIYPDIDFSANTRIYSIYNTLVDAHQIPLHNSRNLTFFLSSHPRIQVESAQAPNAHSIHLLTALLFHQQVTHMIDLTNQHDLQLDIEGILPYCPAAGEHISIRANNRKLIIANNGPSDTTPGFSHCTATLYTNGTPFHTQEFNYHKFEDWKDYDSTSIHNITNLARLLTHLQNAKINIHGSTGDGRSGSLLTLVISRLEIQENLTRWIAPDTRRNRLATILLFLRLYRSRGVVRNAQQLSIIEQCTDLVLNAILDREAPIR